MGASLKFALRFNIQNFEKFSSKIKAVSNFFMLTAEKRNSASLASHYAVQSADTLTPAVATVPSAGTASAPASSFW